MILLITLTACQSNKQQQLKPRVAKKVKVVKPDIPQSLLTPVAAPSANILKNVKIAQGKNEASIYMKDLLNAWLLNKNKLLSIAELLEEKEK